MLPSFTLNFRTGLLMDRKTTKCLKYITIALTIFLIWFNIYDSVESRKIVIKEEYLNGFLKWQKANQKLICYYQQSKNKSVFSKELIESYLKYEDEIDNTLLKIKKELKILDGFGFNSLNRVLNQRLVWTYELYGAYYKDFSEIKEKLNDDELQNAIKLCEHNI